MKKEKIENFLKNLKGSKSNKPFGPDALVFKVMNKMFALVSQKEETPRVTLKCNPADGVILVSQFESIVPGYYMNKKHWITVSLKGDVPIGIIRDLATKSYELVVSKLTKAEKKKLEQI